MMFGPLNGEDGPTLAKGRCRMRPVTRPVKSLRSQLRGIRRALACVLVATVATGSTVVAQVDTDSLRRAHRAQAEATARRVAEAAAVFTDRELSAERRLAAVEGIGGFDRADDVERTIAVLMDRAEPTQVRVRAVQLVAPQSALDESFRHRLLDLVERGQEPLELRRAGMTGLEGALFTWHPEHAEAERTTAALRRLARDPDAGIRASALRVLASRGDAEALELLEQGLLAPGEALLPAAEAVRLLGLFEPSRHYPVLRGVLESPPTPSTRITAIRLLAGDTESHDRLGRILQDSREPLDARQAALGALATGDPARLARSVVQVIGDDSETTALRVRAIKTMELLRTTRDRSAIAARNTDELDAQIGRLATGARDPQVRSAAADYMRRTRTPQ